MRTTWILFTVSLNPSNQINRLMRSAIVIGYMRGSSFPSATDAAHNWASSVGGTLVQVLDQGDLELNPPISILTDSRSLPKPVDSTITNSSIQTNASFMPGEDYYYQILWSSDKSLQPTKSCQHIYTLADALNLFKLVGLIARPLSFETTRRVRQLWRKNYGSSGLRGQNRHACPGCSPGKKPWVFDWEFLDEAKVQEQMPDLRSIAHAEQYIVVFFEKCDLPAFVCSASDLFHLEAQNRTDLYLAPLPDLHWTMVYTHELEYGPYFVKK